MTYGIEMLYFISPLYIIEVIRQKKIEHLEKELKVFISKLERIRSNRISLEAIRGLMVNYQNERKPLKTIANLRISPNHELIARAFEPKMTPLISKTILENQLGYKVERSTKEEVYFTLTPITTQIKEKLIKEDQKKGYEKQADKLVKDYQDKLLTAEEKKTKELNS
ncbi:39219_t:CDS:2 [Gigaspora margarita]|uniref:39219_t:CDS:1 n=1 Tax=Gigaspora margarita TaxID=4874 RepID=A0ABN7UA45_GIGMA|nr:39219_t:CDS:2 [Gigaspora margarita]